MYSLSLSFNFGDSFSCHNLNSVDPIFNDFFDFPKSLESQMFHNNYSSNKTICQFGYTWIINSPWSKAENDKLGSQQNVGLKHTI